MRRRVRANNHAHWVYFFLKDQSDVRASFAVKGGAIAKRGACAPDAMSLYITWWSVLFLNFFEFFFVLVTSYIIHLAQFIKLTQS